MIELRAFGNAEIVTVVTTLTPSQEIVFAAALYLVLERGKRVRRTRLASLLWPSVPEKPRAHRLRQTILQLKKLGIIVRADRNTVQLSEHDARTDVDDFEQSAAEGIAKNDSLEFLAGYSPRFSEPFADWVDSERGKVHAAATRRLVVNLEMARAKGNWPACDRISLQCLQLDPLNESAILALAESSAMRGAKREAVGILDRFLTEIGSCNTDLRVQATLLRRRITERVPDQPTRATRECTFVGRECEMQTLIGDLAQARVGKGGARLIKGEAGIGKSRLTSEVLRFAELDGIRAQRVACRRSDLDRPLSVFVDLIPQLRDLRGSLGCSQETLSVLKRLTEFDGSASDNASSFDDSSSAHARMRRAIFDLLDAVSDEQCLLIVIEDVQWLDPASIKMLSALISWLKTKQLFFLLNERSSAGPSSSQVWQMELQTLTLTPLAPSFAKTLLTSIIDDGAVPVPEEVTDWLLSVGEGNPFFLQELGKQWLETGRQHEFPTSVTTVVDDRLSRLTDHALQVLQACAILGVNATIDRVERMLGYQPHRLLSAVQELSVAGMLQPGGKAYSEIDEKLSVRHDLLSTAALRRLAEAPLAYLHRRAGAVLDREITGINASTSLIWACALHWRHAGDRERAFGAARSYADHLLEVGLSVDAAQAFERTLEYCLTDEQRLLVLARLAVALQMHGQWEQSREALVRCRHIRGQYAGDISEHDDIELALFDASWRASLDNSKLLSEITACVRSENASELHRVASGLIGLKIASNMSDIPAMEELYRIVLPLLGQPAVPAMSRLEFEMIFHSVCGDVQRAGDATKEFLESARAEMNPIRFSQAVGNAAVAHRLGGRKEEAEALFLEVMDHAISHGLTNRASFAGYSLVRLYLAAGDIVQARRTMDRTDLISQPGEDVHLVADQMYLSARIALEEGKIESAASRYENIAAETTRHQSINRRTTVLALGIRIRLSQGADVAALRLLVDELEAAHLLNRAAGWQDFETHALYIGLQKCGELEKARRLLVEYVTVYRREKWPLPQILSDLLGAKGNHESVNFDKNPARTTVADVLTAH
jgi:DNA-binding SARP family transcriptional activator/tetratricopeptide (TPR) repeat protein